VPKSQNPTTSFGRTESLWQADDRRSVILTTILDALTHGPAPISNVTKFRLPTESSKPCSYSIKKWKFLVLYQNQAFKIKLKYLSFVVLGSFVAQGVKSFVVEWYLVALWYKG